MELAVPIIGLAGLYIINNQSKKSNEPFTNKHNLLPNTDIPNRNYPEEYPVVNSDTDRTSSLSVVNKFDSNGVYTDKYWNPNANPEIAFPSNSLTLDKRTNNVQKFTSLSGNEVDSSYFQHNNMVPYFGSHLRTTQTASQSNEGILDSYSGSGSQIFSKKEQAPMFSPHDNLQWAYGAPNASDFFQSRVNPSQKMANVIPFEQVKVGPGVGLGYTDEGAGGFNSGLLSREKWMDPTVDQLRIANKPKASGFFMGGYEGPADSLIKNNSTTDNLGIYEKHRPDSHFEFNQDRYMTTTGAVKGPTLHSIPIDRDVSRPETAVSYSGIASYVNNSTYVDGEHMPSKNQQFGEVPLSAADAVGRGYANDADYGFQSTKSYANNRSQNVQSDYYGVMGSSIGAVVAPLLDILRPSRKENTVGTLRPYQNAKSTVEQSYIFNPADRPAPTIRETTENSKFHMNVDKNQRGGAYQVTENQPIQNARMDTGNFYYAGVAGAGERAREPRPYDAEYNQRNNDIKSSTIQGYMVQGNMSLMNSNINMKTAPKENFLQNSRDIAPTMPYQAPGVDNFGKLQGNNNMNYQNIQLDRSNPEILSSLKGNPFALSVTGGL